MTCSDCGYENRDEARFCAKCGKPLSKETASQDNSNDGTDDASVSSNEATADTTIDSPNQSEDTSSYAPADISQPGFSEIVASKLKRINKKTAIVICGVVAAIVVVIASLAATFFSGPSNDTIKSCLENDLTLATDSSWGVGDAYVISSLTVTDKERQQIPADYQALLGMNEYYAVSFYFEASNSDATVSGSGTADFVYEDNTWQLVWGVNLNDDITYVATAGVSENALMENADSILSHSNNYEVKQLYSGKCTGVSSIEFDESAQTTTATLAFADSSTFSDAETELEARFAFTNGRWDLEEVNAPADATDVNYEKLIGTWNGSFVSTTAGRGANCYGAEEATPSLIITSLDPDSLKIEGTFTGLAHYHDGLEADANGADGDTTIDETPFTATLQKGLLIGGIWNGVSCEVGASTSLPSTTDGTITISFGFGTADDPNKAIIYVETEHEYVGPYSLTLTGRWVDKYEITKAE